MSDGYLRPLAELIVRLGANVQPGQIVAVGANIGQEELARAVAASAYRRGARFVDVTYFDTGKPAAGVFVSAYEKRASGNFANGKSDEHGRLELKLPPGRYKFLGDPPPDSLPRVVSFSVKRGRSAPTTFPAGAESQ